MMVVTAVTVVIIVTEVTEVTEVTVVTTTYCYDQTYWDKIKGDNK